MRTQTWKGLSKIPYEHVVYKKNSQLPSVPANYCVAKEKKKGGWKPIYFGETDNVMQRFIKHHKRNCFCYFNATHIHVYMNDDENSRKLIEKDLKRKWKPMCNGKFWKMFVSTWGKIIGIEY